MILMFQIELNVLGFFFFWGGRGGGARIQYKSPPVSLNVCQLPASTIAYFSLVTLSSLSIKFPASIMAFNLTPEELVRFHAYIQQGGPLTPSAPNTAPNIHPPAFQPSQVPSSASGPPPTQPLSSFIQQTQVQAQPSVTQPTFQPTPSQTPSSGPPATPHPLSSFLQQTQVQGQPSMIQPPPVSQLYQNVRSHQPQAGLGHPAAVTSRPGTSFNPFLQVGGAALSLPTTHANQARMASALSSIPRNPSLPRRGRRGPAQHPPALPSSRKVSINNCLSQDASGGHSLRIIVKVMPPPVSRSCSTDSLK